MAYIEDRNCCHCNKVTMHTNGKCSDCSAKEKAERVRMWNAQDLDTKLNNIRERLEDLERGPMTF